MKLKIAMAATTLVLLLATGSFALYRLGIRHVREAPVLPAAELAASTTLEDPTQWTPAQQAEATQRHMDLGLRAGDIDPVTGRAILHYYDPMLPANKFDAPAKSPFMDMLMVPAYAGVNSDDTSTVSISPRLRQNIGIRTGIVTQGSVTPVISATGSVAWNEREQVLLQARAAGFVERLHVRAALDEVAAGQALIDLYIPEWVAIQEEFVALNRLEATGENSLREAAKARMRQAGMSEAQISDVEVAGRILTTSTVIAPSNGIITELLVREGMAVFPGTPLFRIDGNATVWVHAEVPEAQTAFLRAGAAITATTPSLPGSTFGGAIESLLPEIDPSLRTRRVRIELPNTDGALVAGMLMQVRIESTGRDAVPLVPSEAVIRTGTRTLVILAEDTDRFRPVVVETGLEANGQTEIRAGLQVGQQVVLSGQFLLDSEANLGGLETRTETTEGMDAQGETP